jgi:hypothetical protein
VNPLDRFGVDGKTIITGTMVEANGSANERRAATVLL